MLRTKIISAFPGTGKSTFYEKNKDISIDSDSSNFSWIVDKDKGKIRNPEFPKNYIQHIKDNIGKYEYIFVSSHKEVRDALMNESIFFYIVYPDKSRKEEFLNRYRKRGSDEDFVKLLDSNWDTWISDIEKLKDGYGYKKIKMVLPNLEDELRIIKEETDK